MHLLERRTVSRKTPGDGKLEISASAAERLRAAAATLEVELAGRRAPARLDTLACSCQKVGRSHEHHFVASDLLRSLHADMQVDLHLVEQRSETEQRIRLLVVPAP